MPAFAGMTLTFPSHPSLSTNSRDKAVYFGRVAIVTPHMSPAMAAAGVSKTHEREVEAATSWSRVFWVARGPESDIDTFGRRGPSTHNSNRR
jgi:hypothetical protein